MSKKRGKPAARRSTAKKKAGNPVVREAQSATPTAHRIIGTGRFSSGISDLATNKKYLEDFGKKR
jgi:hypothetical protein